MTSYQAVLDALPRGSAIQLHNVSWDEYETLLEELDERPYLRLTYDQGHLHIKTISAEHNRLGRLFGYLMLVLGEELEMEFMSGGTTTFSRKDTAAGANGDDCFYFDHLAEIGEKDRLDLTVDPPSNLLVEVDVTNPSIKKLPTYATLRIPEIWHFDGTVVRFHRLSDNGYLEVTQSWKFPFLPAAVLPPLLLIGKKEGTRKMMKTFRAWVQANKQ